MGKTDQDFTVGSKDIHSLTPNIGYQPVPVCLQLAQF